MKKFIVGLGALALLSTSALADEYGEHTTTVTVTEHVDKSVNERGDRGCYPVTANYNAGWEHITCPPQGSGPNSHFVTREVEVDVPHTPNDDNNGGDQDDNAS